ncbi:MAG: D-glycerate dehydrogenase [Dehalococcoidia bacterium]|nr:D-glycerate dehydrogenase [Dehalococcoidia bacterium]
MAHVYVTRELPGRPLELLRSAGHTVDTWPGELPPPADVLRERLRDADAAITLLTDRITGELLDDCPNLRVVANVAVGYDNVDPAVAAEHGVWLTNTPGVLAETTADFAFALLLAAARRVVESDRDTRAGGWKTWSPTGFLGPDVHGATLGIVGLGEIGQAVARRALGFDMRVLAYTRTPRDVPGVSRVAGLRELLAASDFVSVHVPLTGQTQHMFGRDAFAAMKPGAVFVNTARGGVVDQEALVAALRERRIAGAALDVTDPEPLPLDHALYTLPNVIITPHIASASVATRSRMAEMAARNVIAVLDGKEPPNAVNRPAEPRGR